MKRVRLTMAQALLKFLDRQYVEFDGEQTKFVQGVIGIFGHGNVTGLGEALEYGGYGLKYIQGHNEQGMVHTATAYAKQKNRRSIFACTSSIGPGAMNMVTGAATATVNRIPVLLLPGDIFSCRQPDPVLQQLEDSGDYSISNNDCFKPVSRYWDRIERPEQLMTAMLNAMRVLTDQAETGAVTISLPQDVQAESYDYPEDFFKKRIHYIDRQSPSTRAVKAAVGLIPSSKRPIIIAGGGVHYSEACKELQDFANTFHIPVGETQAGKSAMSWQDPMSMGGIGVTGTQVANRLAAEADLVIAVGTRLTDFTTASKSAFKPDTPILSINVSRFDGYKMDAVFVEGDARLTLEQLKTGLQAANYVTDNLYIEQIADLRKKWDYEVDHLYSQGENGETIQTAVVGTVNQFLSPDDVIVCAAGSLPGDLHRLWRVEKPKSYHMEYGYSCMGYEIAGGLGVKMAVPESECYVIVGDGSYLMLHSELLTSIQEGYKINVVLLDSSGFACIKSLQQSQGSKGFGNDLCYRNPETDLLDGDIVKIDFAGYAKALGVETFTATNIRELKAALEATKRSSKSTLIDVKTVPGTMSGGYDSWWRVGVAETSNNDQVQKAYRTSLDKIETTRDY